jgi:hypothetical protein
VSYAVVLWYYVPKDPSGEKEEAPKQPAIFGAMVAVRYHLGSLIYMAAMMPWLRAVRVIDDFLFGSLPYRGEQQADYAERCCCCKALCFQLGFIRRWFDVSQYGPFQLYTKDVVVDIVIRSNHLEPGAKRAAAVKDSHAAVKKHMGHLYIITLCGVLTIGTLCAFFTYQMCTSVPSFSDPLSGWYVQDPMMIAFLSFCLCGSIAYSFTMLLDQTSDVLLYSYAWNKKFKKTSCEKFMPETLKNVVGVLHMHADSYPLYGHADPNMYLGTFMATKTDKKAAKERNTASMAGQSYGPPGNTGMMPGSMGMMPGGSAYASNPYGNNPVDMS